MGITIAKKFDYLIMIALIGEWIIVKRVEKMECVC
jgi:hypothetical protein